MERLELEVEAREGRGKGPGRRLRAKGFVPAVVYGAGSEAIALAVSDHALEKAVHGGANRLFDLKGIAAVKGKLVLVKELQRDPLSRRLVHCDFYTVDTTKKLEVQIPLHLTGKPVGIDQGGVLEPLMREIQVSCLPLSIPSSLTLDVSALNIGDALHARDIALPEGVELVTDPSVTVVHVIAPRVEEEPKPVDEAAAAAAAEGAASAEGAKDEGK
jgi:large subunit ribosomal protein L25